MTKMVEPVIRASEIGSYLFCKRAWWYQRQDAPSTNTAELARGSRAHTRHWVGYRLSGMLRMLAGGLVGLALILLLLQIFS